MDARVLIGIFDLGAAFLDADIGALVFRADATLPNDWIALGAEAHGEIAGRLCAGRKVLMKHAVRGRKAQSGTPIDPLQIAMVLPPKQRVARALDEERVQT